MISYFLYRTRYILLFAAIAASFIWATAPRTYLEKISESSRPLHVVSQSPDGLHFELAESHSEVFYSPNPRIFWVCVAWLAGAAGLIVWKTFETIRARR
jgi:hypothetical protein